MAISFRRWFAFTRFLMSDDRDVIHSAKNRVQEILFLVFRYGRSIVANGGRDDRRGRCSRFCFCLRRVFCLLFSYTQESEPKNVRSRPMNVHFFFLSASSLSDSTFSSPSPKSSIPLSMNPVTPSSTTKSSFCRRPRTMLLYWSSVTS